MKRWLLVPILSASLFVPISARADDLSTQAAQVKSQLQTQWLPAWAKISTANEPAVDAAEVLQTLSHAHRLGYSTPQLNLLEAATAHYKLLRDSRRDKTNEGFYARAQDSKEPVKSTLLQAQVVKGLVEYARASGQAEPRGLAVKAWRFIRDKGRDKVNGGGYYDSIYTVQATPLSATAFGPKTAPTHLALLEAATELYDLTRDRSIRTDLGELLDLNDGRFFSVRPEDRGWSFKADWQVEQKQPEATASGAAVAMTQEAAVAIVRAQTVLGNPVGWVDFTRRAETQGASPSPATLSAQTQLVQVTSNREAQASQLDATLNTLGTTAPTIPTDNGVALLDFVAAFEKK